MFPYLILGIALLAGLLLAGRWYATADPRALIRALKWGLVGLVALVAVFFVVTGRLGWALMTLPALVPWFLRARSVARMAKTFSRMTGAAGGGATGETSDVETAFLRMTLDHDSGQMTGEVLAGAFAGRRIESLSQSELLALLEACRHEDAEAARLVEAYLEREFPDWRETGEPAGTSGGTSGSGNDGWQTAQPGGMSRDEALQILGLEKHASAADIKDAHRRLIAGLHPDHGGSDYLAAQINRAKDVLLGE